MGLIDWIFRRHYVECPRCLGKGVVNDEDIKRLKQELFWIQGPCAYCSGAKRVLPDMMKKVSPDIEYLTTDLSSEERTKVINGDKKARARAAEHKDSVLEYIKEIEHLYYIENKEADEIANIFFRRQNIYGLTSFSKQDILADIKKVLQSKRSQ